MTLSPLLQRLPWSERMQAYSDFETVARCRLAAHRWKSYRLPGWRLDHKLELRRAIRAWKHYAEAVRKARDVRIAA